MEKLARCSATDYIERKLRSTDVGPQYFQREVPHESAQYSQGRGTARVDSVCV